MTDATEADSTVDEVTLEPLSDAEIIARRSADIHEDEAKDNEHVKVFVLPPGVKPTEANGYDHSANKAATRQYALSQGMRPIGDVRLVSTKQHVNGISWVLTYAVEVAVAERIAPPSGPDIVLQGEDAPANADENGHEPDTSDEKGESGQAAGAPADKGGEPNRAPADEKSAE